MKSYFKNGNYQKPYFPFNFDPSQLEDTESLDRFYQQKFKELAQKEYFIHLHTLTDIKSNVNTGCLIGRNISSGLEYILRMFGTSKSKTQNQGRQVKLKNFRFLDGQIKNTNIIIRVVKEQTEDDLTGRNFEENAFNIVHFFQKQQERGQVSTNSKIQNENQMKQPTTRYTFKSQQSNMKQEHQDLNPLNNEPNLERKGVESNNQKNIFNNEEIPMNGRQNQSENNDHSNMNNNNDNSNNNESNNNIGNNNNNSSSINNNSNQTNMNNNIDNNSNIYQRRMKNEQMRNQMQKEMKQEYFESTQEEKQIRSESKAYYYYNVTQKQQQKIDQQNHIILEMKIKQLELELKLSQQNLQKYATIDNKDIIID